MNRSVIRRFYTWEDDIFPMSSLWTEKSQSDRIHDDLYIVIDHFQEKGKIDLLYGYDLSHADFAEVYTNMNTCAQVFFHAEVFYLSVIQEMEKKKHEKFSTLL